MSPEPSFGTVVLLLSAAILLFLHFAGRLNFKVRIGDTCASHPKRISSEFLHGSPSE